MPNFNRKDMPQVKTQDLGKAIDMVSDKVSITKGSILASKLKKSQKELYKDKVIGIANKYNSPNDMKPIIISNDYHIVDGHHRWGAAIHKWGDGVKIPIYKINLSVKNAIKLYKQIADMIDETIKEMMESTSLNEGGVWTIDKYFGLNSIVPDRFRNVTSREQGVTIRKMQKIDLVGFEDWKNSLNEANAVAGGKVHKLITGKNLTFKGKKYSDIEFEVLGIDNNSQIVKLKILAPKNLFGEELNVPFKTIRRGPFLKTDTSKQFEGTINEMPMDTLKDIDRVADKFLNPVDVVLTNQHFFDRLNDPRNDKEISSAELIGFFKRLSKYKKEFVDFLNQYNQIVAVDDRTNINIPFMKQANKAIAKTIMRKKDFKTPNKKLEI
jgi:hypothetical protein